MGLINSAFSVPMAIVAAFLLASCTSARIDPLEFDYYAQAGEPVDASANTMASRRPEVDPVVPLHDAADSAAVPAGDHVSSPATAVAQTHRIQKGESLYGLSRRFLGAGKRWREIARLNGLSDAEVRRLPVGREIKIPAR